MNFRLWVGRSIFMLCSFQKSVRTLNYIENWGTYKNTQVHLPFVYSCGQTKSSNLLTDFFGLGKASELVDNGINEFLLISLINSNGQNFQKWWYKGFYTPKIWPVPEKIAKNTKNIPTDSFLFPLFDPTKIFPKYWSEINQKSVSNSGNFAGTVTWSYPFQVKVSRKQI